MASSIRPMGPFSRRCDARFGCSYAGRVAAWTEVESTAETCCVAYDLACRPDADRVYRGLHRGRSAANIPKGWNLVMSRALLVAVKAPFGASRVLGFLAAAHGVAHAAPITSCQFEDGNPDGLP